MGSRGSDYDCLREAELMRMGWSRRDLRCEVTCAENCTLCADDTLSLYAEESQHMSPPMTDILGGVILNGIPLTVTRPRPAVTHRQQSINLLMTNRGAGGATLCKLTPPQLRIQEVRVIVLQEPVEHHTSDRTLGQASELGASTAFIRDPNTSSWIIFTQSTAIRSKAMLFQNNGEICCKFD